MTSYQPAAKPHSVTRIKTLLAQVMVSGLAVCAGVLGTGSAAVAAAACPRPALMKVPATTRVVGSGTAASCTQAALRAAVAAGGHLIFACGGGKVTIAVTTELQIRKTTVIDGQGEITLDGGGKHRIVAVQGTNHLSVRNMRFINGAAAESTDRARGAGGAVAGLYRAHVEVVGSTFVNNTAGLGGGAVYGGVQGTLTIIGSTFTGNKSWYGGAVYSLLSPLTVINSTFTANRTVNVNGMGEGGAIGTDGAGLNGPGTILLCGATITDNKAFSSGGGAYLWAYAPQTVIVEKTTFAGNRITANGHGSAGAGGGARISVGPSDVGVTGTISISDTSVMSNTSTENGGGLYLDCAPVCKIVNATFYRNTAGANGGAIFGDGHHDNNVTFAQNTAGGHGGALFGAKFVLDNSVFAGNSAKNPWGQAMSCGTTGTGKHVLQWARTSRDTSTGCIGTVIAKNPGLAAPADNGGPTATMLPAANSPVLKAGAGCATTDQRGVLRTASVCDLGAVERTRTAPTKALTSTLTSASGSPAPAAVSGTQPSPGTSTGAMRSTEATSWSAGQQPAGSAGILAAAIAAAAVALLGGLMFRRSARSGSRRVGRAGPDRPAAG